MPTDPLTDFDPDAPITSGTLFGLPHRREDARVIVTPVPFDGTVSYGTGSAQGPDAIRRASQQIDLLDPIFGPVYDAGIHMEGTADWMPDVARRARELALPIIEAGGPTNETRAVHEELERLCAEVEGVVYHAIMRTLTEGKLPVLLGGEHGVSLGGIVACCEWARDTLGVTDIGVLQLDAHRDLRESYLGMSRSHASVMRNVLERNGLVTRLVQVGIRDAGVRESAYAEAMGGRVVFSPAHLLHQRLDDGESFTKLAGEIIEMLPQHVYVSFDIDALDPSCCPNTGTPVPGGLSYSRAMRLLELLSKSGKRIIGCDLVEVAPGKDGDEWDANVGMRVLYGLIGCMVASQG